jgi:hypothetical protein
MTRIDIGAALVAFVISAAPAGAIAQALQPTPEFEAALATATKSGATQTAKISIQSWELPNQGGTEHEIPLKGFYVAHLLSGDIAATVDGQTTKRLPGAYWAVKVGATMQVKVLSELAVLETIVPTKP